jgi:hypothetical protein
MKKISVIFLVVVCAFVLFVAINSSYSDDSCKKHAEISGDAPNYGTHYTSCYDTMVVTIKFHSMGGTSHYAYGVDGTSFYKDLYTPAPGNYVKVDTAICTSHTNHRLWFDLYSGGKYVTNVTLSADYLDEPGQQGQ